jgi:hypothetical protein
MATFDKSVLRFIRVGKFIDECTDLDMSPYLRHKFRGMDGNKVPINFTDEEVDEILKGFKKLAEKLLSVKPEYGP